MSRECSFAYGEDRLFYAGGMKAWDFHSTLARFGGGRLFACPVYSDETGQVEFQLLDDRQHNLLTEAKDAGTVKIPRGEVRRLQKVIERLHRFAQSADASLEQIEFIRTFRLPDPATMPGAWLVTGTWRRRLHLLWGYRDGNQSETTFLPSSAVSGQWSGEDSAMRYDVRARTRPYTGGSFTRRFWSMIFLTGVLLAVGGWFWYQSLFCPVHHERMHGGVCPRVCEECGRHAGAGGDCVDPAKCGVCGRHTRLREDGTCLEPLAQDVCKVCQTHKPRTRMSMGACLEHYCKICGGLRPLTSAGVCEKFPDTEKCRTCGKHCDPRVKWCPDCEKTGY